MNSIPKEIYEDSIIEMENKLNPYKIYYDILITWLNNKIENDQICNYLKNCGINNIAIYGMGELGQLLYKELFNTDINIMYTVDNCLDAYKIKNFNSITSSNIDKNALIDAIIITPIYAASSIKEDLKNIYADKAIKLLTLDEVIYGVS